MCFNVLQFWSLGDVFLFVFVLIFSGPYFEIAGDHSSLEFA